MYKHKQNIVILSLILWFAATLAALYYLKADRIKQFDPEGALTAKSSTMAFDDELVNLLKKRGIKANTLVHFSEQPSCYCNNLSQRFSKPLHQQLGSEYTFENVELDESLLEFIPSYPAIAVIDDQFRLRYLGPYASGIGCWVGKGNTEKIVNIAKSSDYFGAVINSEVKGCYCNT
ncbi:hypothetical protein J3L16_12475 [Alteromonas sp. 5E99-2]|uniref:DUF6436 domain-containing protein n=1 Tax=Alteromonas sp. 5E99-2 TaxID=2817683 RepID=UPI001A9991F4|nr:DUF6436 domain-containing protein [Alteromonas sp. 5E99-2]MBO1256499.1 hypothetical protein [Alteromonas sp. 5E99-2]